MNEATHRLGNGSPSFHSDHTPIRAVEPRDLHHAKGRGLQQCSPLMIQALCILSALAKNCTRCQEAKHFDAMKSLVYLIRVGGFCLSLFWSVGLYRGEEVDSREALFCIPLSILGSSTAPRSGLGIHVRHDPWKFHKPLRSCHRGGIQQ